MTINKLCVCPYVIVSASSMTHSSSLCQLILPSVVLLREYFLNIAPTHVSVCERERETHIPLVVPMWLSGFITEHRMVTLAKEKLEPVFPALERPICVFQRLVYLTQDLSLLPPST